VSNREALLDKTAMVNSQTVLCISIKLETKYGKRNLEFGLRFFVLFIVISCEFTCKLAF
jgi:hypothetical protein